MFLDIETLPAGEENLEKLEKVWQRRRKKAQARGQKGQSFEEFVENTNLSGAFGRIFCISYAIDEEEPVCLAGAEKEMLEQFWIMAEDMDRFIGHNILEFDLRFILQRSMILGVKPSREISFRKYTNHPVFDTMHEWNKWTFNAYVSLDELAHAFDLETSKKGIDGSQVHAFYKDGRHEEIKNYCNADVALTRKVYKKMNFE